MADLTLYHELLALLPGRVRAGEPMKKHTSWRIGGPADVFVEPGTRSELQLVVSFAKDKGVPLTVIGAGSNLLVSDGGIRGVVVKIGNSMARVVTAGKEITAEAGAKLAAVASTAMDAGLGGFEFSNGIPGTVGGAVVMNAGANGSTVSTLVKNVLVLSFEGDFINKNKEDMCFGYRNSILHSEPAIIVEVTFTCYPRDKELIRKEMADYLTRRKASQPLCYPNAGSVFKNPPGESAGRLIEAAGLKGMRVRNAQISTQHANFIINLGSATARDVLALIEHTREVVNSRFGVDLQPEIKLTGHD
ncbi:UDP-N-acetylmuramate dehydrogenase [Pelotomaculum terephthalicicum JT]|uniref:UDP-N-acetylmuramate dehydrogenase n=1 Tax=Pelotomaculum TaxID=191373 RepID=UPI0009D57090|nr:MULTISPECIES: UDP-N-acetylmuramate dehydrogenase [Pelotomaculum]MCG9968077.1 UDP-N-acetylmuramate dehydrogenase [Pelotomaculum terephthalicicum JT]OPX85624.1 MAG: UDP-N-acetylenolpyruvoylglucosamine reductase [Pelotomaculum sp. PtaB.Bin117]OPY64004.1 MAG: UDP-N-acetylenolpyruvoylglucosamine reductase [Pelotomaculum sp. PtaU1.Bin065]